MNICINKNYSNKEWFFAKTPFIIVWLFLVWFVIVEFKNVKNEIGICNFLNCDILNLQIVKVLIILIAAVFSVLYVFEKWMLITISVLCFISILVFSAGNSNGIFYRNEILSGILIAQFLAYLKFKFKGNFHELYNDRFKYSVQIIAAAYVLSALKKLQTSGLEWIISYKEFALKAKTNLLIINANWSIDLSNYANFVYKIFFNYPAITISILSISLLLELFAFLMVINKKMTLIYGGVLFIFHAGIFLTMFVYVPPVLISVFTFVLNVPYLIYSNIMFCFKKIR